MGALSLRGVAVGKTPGEVLSARLHPVNNRDEVKVKGSTLVPARVRMTGPAAI
jgi:hypothetical protein